MANINSVIRLESVYQIDNIDGAFQSVIGYYSNYINVVNAIKKLVDSDDYGYVMFLTDEYSIDIFSDDNSDYDAWLKTRQYKVIDNEVVMTHETVKDYKGFIADEYSYKPGDIIEYMDYDNRVGTGIIGYTPITAEEANKRQLQLDHFDDSYLVYGLGEGDTHHHISSFYILGLADVTPEVYKQYKDKLEERYKNN